MKRYNHLFEQITTFENIFQAAKKAQKGKCFKSSTARFNLNLEKELFRLQHELQTQTYRHGGYNDFYVFDPKMRLISAAPYRDRVVHHALCNVIEPLLDRTFIHDSYACRKGKGAHAAVNRYTAFARKNKYVLQCDIAKYFPSIDHAILFRLMERKIKCPQTLWLINAIIQTRCEPDHNHYFPGDDLFTPYYRPKGLPLGNLTSQFFANVYLNGFDHFVKETLKCKHYIRYVDDFVVLDNDKERLHQIKANLVAYLNTLRLRLHPRKSRMHRVQDGINFLGYKVFPTHRLLKKQNVLHMRRKLKKLSDQYRQGRIGLDKVRASVHSWIGHARHADTWRLRERLFAGVTFQRGDAN